MRRTQRIRLLALAGTLLVLASAIPTLFQPAEIQGDTGREPGASPRAATYPDYLYSIGGKLIPNGIAVNNVTGQVYVTDYGKHHVWVFDRVGAYQYSIGTPEVAGSDNAHFNGTWGVAVNGSGHVYVADAYNYRVQVFDSAGVYQYTIGTGTPGSGNNQFNLTMGVAVNSTGHAFVVDFYNQRVQVFDKVGTYQYTIGTTGVWGSDSAHFFYPYDVEVNATGYVYVADSENDRVQVFDKAGTYQYTIGVTGVGGVDNAHLNRPLAIAVNATGHVYVVDSNNERVQVFDKAGIYQYTIGTSGEWGTDNAHLQSPSGTAVNGTGHLYVADLGNYRVQVFDRAGIYQYTINEVGVVAVENAHFDSPAGVAVNNITGHLYIADTSNHRVQVFDKAGIYQYSICGIGKGTGNNQLNVPMGVAVNGTEHVYVVDCYNDRVQVFNGAGAYQYTIGVTGESGSDNAHFFQPKGVAVNGTGHVFVADAYNNRVQVFDKAGTYQYTISGLSSPSGVAMNVTGHLYVADTGNHRVRVYSPTRTYLYTIGAGQGNGNNNFDSPLGVALNSTGHVYVADYWNHRIQVFDNAGKYQYTIGTTDISGIGNYRFNNPAGVAVNGTGHLYIADFSNDRVQVFNKTGTYQYTIGRAQGSDNTHFDWPRGVAVNATRHFYVADMGNHRVQVFDSAGTYQYTIGESGMPGTDSTHFYTPSGVAVNASGHVYVADTGNHRVQVFDHAGTYCYTIGVTGVLGIDNGHFDQPMGIAVNATGYVYVSDFNNWRVQVFNSAGTYQYTLAYVLPDPIGIAVNATGHVYVVASYAHAVFVFNSTGIFKYYIGTDGELGSDNTHLKSPCGVAVNATGHVYVADAGNNRVQVFDRSGTYLYTIGMPWEYGFGSSNFNSPQGIAVDNATGHLYLADTNNHRVLVFGVLAPKGLTISINGGATDTSSTSVTLTLNATGATQMCFSNNGTTYTDWEAYSISKAWGLAGGPGPKIVYFKARCDLTEAAPVTDTINYTLPPIISSFTIMFGFATTGTTLVGLQLSVSGATQMCFSNNGSTYSDWEPYAGTKMWTLDEIPGPRRVYFKARNGTIEAGPVSDTIIYVAPPTDLYISINSGAEITNNTNVMLTLSATGAQWMCFSNNGTTYTNWEAYGTSKAWTLDGGPGPKMVYFKAQNITYPSAPVTSTITYIVNPTGLSLTINDGADMTASRTVTLVVWASGAEEMCFSNDGDVWSTWEPFTATKNWGLTGGPGFQTVYFKARNSTIESLTSASITYTIQPNGLSIVINSGAENTDVRTVTLTLTATGAEEMCFSNDGAAWSAWETFKTTKTWDLPSVAGYKTVYFKVRNDTIESAAPIAASITYAPPSPVQDEMPAWAWGIVVVVIAEAVGLILVIWARYRKGHLRVIPPPVVGEEDDPNNPNHSRHTSLGMIEGDAKL